jgi:hypothetical protein
MRASMPVDDSTMEMEIGVFARAGLGSDDGGWQWSALICEDVKLVMNS